MSTRAAKPDTADGPISAAQEGSAMPARDYAMYLPRGV